MRGSYLIAAAALSLAGAGAGLAMPTETSVKLKAELYAKQQVPRQAVKAPSASGRFTGSLTVLGRSGTLTWRLTYSRLSSRPTSVYIQLGPSGVMGEAAVRLCLLKACKSGINGRRNTSIRVTRALLNGRAYVEIHTKKNPKGEIRGQIAKPR